MPIRVQLRRQRGFRLPANTVIVARPTKWGNPYRVTPRLLAMCDNKADAQFVVVQCMSDWMNGSKGGAAFKRMVRKELRGHNLACWCRQGSPCHADLLLKIANP